MKDKQALEQFVQKHELNATLLPNRTKYWHLSSAQIADLKLTMDGQFPRTAHPDFPREVYIWEKGPVLYEGLFGAGLLFCNLFEADPVLPKIRSHGFSEEEWFPYFALNREDVNHIFGEFDYTVFYLDPCQPITDETQTIAALEKPYGYLIEGSDLWFATEEHVRRFEAFIEEIERML